MLTKKIESALNEQIVMEAFSSNAYLAIASWCDVKGFRGATQFYYDQSDEERMHMLKLVKYVNASGAHANITEVSGPQRSFNNLKETFEVALQQEQKVSESIHNLVELTFNEKDYTTHNFLQWYVKEQHEEESLFRSILDLFEMAGDDTKSLIILDNEITKIRAEFEAEEAAA